MVNVFPCLMPSMYKVKAPVTPLTVAPLKTIAICCHLFAIKLLDDTYCEPIPLPISALNVPLPILNPYAKSDESPVFTS